MKEQNIKRIFVAISLILFLSSLTQNAYLIDNGEESVGSFGLIALLLGWMGVFGPAIAWLANPCLLLSGLLLIIGKTKLSLLFSVLAVGLALSFLLVDEIIANEGGGKGKITAYDTGYWLWLSSCLVNLLGNLVIKNREKDSL